MCLPRFHYLSSSDNEQLDDPTPRPPIIPTIPEGTLLSILVNCRMIGKARAKGDHDGQEVMRQGAFRVYVGSCDPGSNSHGIIHRKSGMGDREEGFDEIFGDTVAYEHEDW